MTVAKNLEKVFFPPNVVIAGGVLLLSYLGWKFGDSLTFFFTILASLSTIFLFKNKIKDENKLYALSAVPSLPTFIICSFILNPSIEMIYGCLSLFPILLLGYIIRPKWKISGHTAASTAVPITLSMIDIRFLFLIIILPPVTWSRLKLKAHTPTQVTAGIILGSTIPIIVFTIFF